MKRIKKLIMKAKAPRCPDEVRGSLSTDAGPVNVPIASSTIHVSTVPGPADEGELPTTLDNAQTNSLPQLSETNVVLVDEGQASSVPEAIPASRAENSSTVGPDLHAPAVDLREPPITLERVRAAALQQLKETGLLSPADYTDVENTAGLQDILQSVEEIISREINTPAHAKKITGVLKLLLQRLGKFESAVDMLAGSMPQVCGFNLVGVIWGSVKLFIAIERANADTVETVVRLLDDVLIRTNRMLDLYIKMDGASRNKLPAQPVVDLYAKLIAFSFKAAKLLKLPSHERHSLIADIDCLTTEVKAADERVSKLIWMEYMSFAFEIQNDDRRDKIHRWLLDPDGSSSRNAIRDISLTHNTVCEKREPDTGLWFLEGESFRRWKAHDKSFLWLRAIPGGGKTVLCSTIIEDVRALCEADPSSSFAYFYFTDRSDLEDLVRSILSQLSAHATPAALAKLYNRYQQTRQHPPMKDLVASIPPILEGFGHVYLIFDALDECPKRRELLRWLEGIISAKLDGVHLLVTSRWEDDIRASLEPLIPDIIDIGSQVDGDILIYIREAFRTDRRFTRHNWPEEVQERIQMTFMERAKGMFRWVALQLDSLEYCRIAKDVYQCLESLPEGLDETYDRILSKIKGQDRKWAKRVLECLAFSARLMSLDEVGEIAAFNPDNRQFDERLPDPHAVLEICSSLITISSGTDGMEGFLSLSHFTVKEYLTSQRIQIREMSMYGFDQEAAHTFMCRTVLAYLMQFDKSNSLSEENITDFPLALYAAKFWMYHAEMIRPGAEDVQKAILGLLQPQNAQYLNWLGIHDPDDRVRRWFAKLDIAAALPLYYASLCGMEKTAQMLIENQANVNSAGGFYGNALQAASAGGHAVIVQLLLDNHADINAQGGECGNALQAASAGGHEAVARLLVENHANVNAEGGHFGNALYAASQSGREAVARLLIENHANVNAKGGVLGSALQVAAADGYEAIVQLLLENHANVNAEGGHFGNALQAASASGHQAIVQLLLERHANVNAEGGHYGNALCAASQGGHDAVARLLIENHADVNAKGGIYGNALHAAIQWRHEEIVRLLLENHADVNVDEESHGSALQAAAARGDEAIVQLLLENHADINAEGGRDGSALQVAAAEGYEAIVQLLLENHANVDANGGVHGNALQAASACGHEAIVQLLLKNHTNVNAEGGYYGNALQAAAARGHETVARLLLENHANVNANGGLYGTAIQAAAACGHEAVARLLLENQANVNADGGFYGSALQAASAGGYQVVARLLLENHADLNAQGGFFGNALNAALEAGHTAIVHLLTDHQALLDAEGGMLQAA